jgi:hypothetical protein
VRVRAYTSGDLEEILRIHRASGLEYRLPEMEDWRTTPKVVVENDVGRMVAAAALRLTSEAYLWLDREAGEPEERWRVVVELHEAVRREAERVGYADVHAFLPPEMPKGFKRRLKKLGWVREEFEPWWRPVARLN